MVYCFLRVQTLDTERRVHTVDSFHDGHDGSMQPRGVGYPGSFT
jgi:hypothetical protein